MLIVCPSCGIKYNVPASYLSKDRTLKCASCGESWLVQAIREPAVETAAPPVALKSEETSVPPAAPAEPAVTPEPAAPSPDQPEAVAESRPIAPDPQASFAPTIPETPPAKEDPAPADVIAAPQPEPASALPVEAAETRPPAAVITEEQPQAQTPAEPAAAEPAVAEPVPVSSPSIEKPSEPLAAHEPEPAEAFHEDEHPEEAVVPASPTHLTQPPEDTAHEPFTSFLDETPKPIEVPFRISDEDSAFHEAPREPEPAPTPEPTPAVPPAPTRRYEAPGPAQDEHDEKPFSFLDLPGTIGAADTTEITPQKGAQPPHQPESPESEAPSSSYIWDEKDLDSHFGQTEWQADNVSVHEGLAGETEELDHLDFESLHESEEHLEGGADVPWARSPHHEADHQEGNAEPQDVNGIPDDRFDEVIGRIRATRNRNPEVDAQGTPPHRTGHEDSAFPHDTDPDEASGGPWVPAWDRAIESAETELDDGESDHEPIWAVHSEEKAKPTEEEAPATQQDMPAAPVPAIVGEEEAARHVTPAIDISSRLRSDILSRSPSRVPGKTGAVIESQQFWKKAWIASGVCAVIGLGACVHWFSALSHIWPALSLL
ncbi:zinc-ribbon domain-containing protein [Acetobacter conturbans]|uniref:Zinc finger/thioredoxin putative domain-containing protein n=1 Tax=Acetobacter conturbans TaxID=1737472 RepID=A0ABX0JYM9_9PROT|nr:zinc-ribbon domain-containing protein [Acetobacter conturbans]NHN87153.1 hypothetical protein [Acetobacter conturbans]